VFFKIQPSQKIHVAIPSLTKDNAKNHGTVVSEKVKDIIQLNGFKAVSSHEINSIKFDNLDLFDLEKHEYKYIHQKNQIINEFLWTHLGVKNEKLLMDLRNNCYTHELISVDNKEIVKEIKNYIDEWHS